MSDLVDAARRVAPGDRRKVLRMLADHVTSPVFDAALVEVEAWNKSAAAQLDGQLRERRRNFTRRIEAVTRIQTAASGLDDRISELRQMSAALSATQARLAELCAQLLDDTVPEAAPGTEVEVPEQAA